MDYEKASEFIKVLGHPVRLRMVEGLLRQKECNVDKMMKALDLPQSTVSQHLALLKSRGIVQMRKEGVKTCYRVVDARAAEIIEILKK